jgi:acyl-CoA thioester hydrolase
VRHADHAVSVELEVPFHDVDSQRVVWHGHYLKYLEIARCALLRARGLDVEQVLALGYQFMVGESHCRHLRPLVYGSRFRVTAWFVEVEQRLDVEYELFDLTNSRRCATARTMLVTTDLEGRMCLATPAQILERLPQLTA